MSTKNRVQPGVPTGGQFAPQIHDEADVTLAATGPESWESRPVHDLMTQMAPDLLAEIQSLRRGGPTPPEGMSEDEWQNDLSKVEKSFGLAVALAEQSFLGPDDRAVFEEGMDVMRQHGHDGRLAAHTASTVTPALNRFGDHLAGRRIQAEEMRGTRFPEAEAREAEVRECAAAFEQARSDFVNGIQTPERVERTKAAANWLADNYLGLYT